MTNKITEELIAGVVASSNIDTISTSKFFRHCLNDEYAENVEFLKSKGCDMDYLKDALDDHIEVEDAQLQIFSQVKDLMNKRGSFDPTMTQDLKKVFDTSKNKAQQEQRQMLFEDVLNAIYEVAATDPDMYVVFFLKKSGYKHDPNSGTSANGKYKFLSELCDDLGERAKKKLIDPLIGRRTEVERIVEVLAHYKKKNPMLVGLPGVGKTAVVEGLASLIEQGQVPEDLKNSRVYSLNVGNVLAGSKFRGEFEEKVKGVLKDLKTLKEKDGINGILFIDEIHQVMGAGAGGSKEGVDLANMIKPGLANGDLSCIGATTEDEYNQKIIKDKALSRRFQVVKIEEPSAKETLRILEQGIRPVLEKYHQVKYPKAVLQRIVDLSDQYVTQLYFPDKAISITDSVGARIKTTLKRSRVNATIDDVEQIISAMTGTPVSAFKQSKDKNSYVDISANIKEVLFGQEDAIDKVVEQVELAKAGLRDIGQPIGSFLLLGPTGTGKTELAKQIAAQTEANFFQLNMSEFSEEHSVAKLFGAPPGYEGHDAGGVLTNQIMKYPHTILLLDEIEKAHKKVYDALLGIIDGASMTDGRDNAVDFSNVLVLMTSNVGAAAASQTKRPLGLTSAMTEEVTAKSNVMEGILNTTFSPEFRNKLSGLVKFNSLSEDIMVKIVEKFIKLAQFKLTTKGIKLSVSKKAKELLAERGFDPAMGARPIKREIDVSIVKELVKPILKKELVAGDT
ncbi:ATP-dependent Clp protease ATP-binding subunit, partial [Candidatus Pacearchaeota archaeon]|nr:ATP-dependent Clp protease ATP-binding subunit [Candidatus Pacearchaeota archaeon]